MVFCKMRQIEVPRHCGHCEEFKDATKNLKKFPKRENLGLQFPTEPIDFRLMKEKE